MSGMDTAKQMKTDMNEFIVSKYFDINTRREKYILYTGSLRFPDIGWIKVKTDDAAWQNLSLVSMDVFVFWHECGFTPHVF